MSSLEFAEWLAYERISPGDPERDDNRAALICSVIANASKSPKTKPFEINDFLLKFKPPRRAEPAKEIRAKLNVWKSLLKRRK